MRLRSQVGRTANPAFDRVPPQSGAQSGTAEVETMLIDAGAVTAADRDRVAEYRGRTGASFADAAVELGLISPETARRALTEHAPGRLIDPDTSGVSAAVVAAFDPTDPLVLKLRALRATLFTPDDMRHTGMRILVLTGIGTDDSAGVAANLAVLVAQLGLRGLLVDANFATPTQHALFGVAPEAGVTSLLVGSEQSDALAVATPVPNLDLLSTGPEIAAVAETVERTSLVVQLRAMRQDYAFAIIDAGEQPPEIVTALARGSDGVVIVAERRATPIERIQGLLVRLDRNEIPILGTVLAR